MGIQDWSLSDLTIGLYLIYLRQGSTNPFEDISGVQISSDAIVICSHLFSYKIYGHIEIMFFFPLYFVFKNFQHSIEALISNDFVNQVQDLIYYLELAKGSYKDSAASLARNSMLRECNILKFVGDSSVMRPGYYIGVDTRKKLVIFGIRGTHTLSDLITDIVTSSDGEVTFEGYVTHFGTAESARWFLDHEMGMIRRCLEKYQVVFMYTEISLAYCLRVSIALLLLSW